MWESNLDTASFNFSIIPVKTAKELSLSQYTLPSYALFSVNKMSSLQTRHITEIKHLSTLLTVESQHSIQMFGQEPSGPSEMGPNLLRNEQICPSPQTSGSDKQGL